MLHTAVALNGAEHYTACAQLTVTAGPKSVTSLPATGSVSLPGAYKNTDPGLKFDAYDPFTSYPFPGPLVTDLSSPPSSSSSSSTSDGDGGSGTSSSSPATNTPSTGGTTGLTSKGKQVCRPKRRDQQPHLRRRAQLLSPFRAAPPTTGRTVPMTAGTTKMTTAATATTDPVTAAIRLLAAWLR